MVTLSLTAVAAVVPVFGGFALRATLTRHRSARKLGTTLSNMCVAAANPAVPTASPAVPSATRPHPYGLREIQQLRQQIVRAGQRWIDTDLGRRIVTEEDRKLFEKYGCYDERARMAFDGTHILLPPLLTVFDTLRMSSVLFMFAFGFASFTLSYLTPKWLLGRRKGSRRCRMGDRLPAMVDILRLLQGADLPIDRGLQAIANEFHGILSAPAGKFGRANQQFTSNRPREQMLLRIARLFDNKDPKGLTTLLTQVDRLGGVVQEPLRQFGGRLRENHRVWLKEYAGKPTVQMTTIMVMTLSPASLIITVGPGFMGAIRSFQQAGGH